MKFRGLIWLLTVYVKWVNFTRESLLPWADVKWCVEFLPRENALTAKIFSSTVHHRKIKDHVKLSVLYKNRFTISNLLHAPSARAIFIYGVFLHQRCLWHKKSNTFAENLSASATFPKRVQLIQLFLLCSKSRFLIGDFPCNANVINSSRDYKRSDSLSIEWQKIPL